MIWKRKIIKYAIMYHLYTNVMKSIIMYKIDIINRVENIYKLNNYSKTYLREK